MENINEALSLLLVGLITVFVILYLVVLIGNLVIRFTNRFMATEPIAVRKEIATGKTKPANPAKIAAVIAAVEAITGGKGRVEKIDKIEK
ncbi:MAG: OadG family transporter subunit [Petrimonas sp.]|uniref:OadG family transporter subunit n=1 Tax=Petrimonas sp. TaxID=2023866 RepID=UPI002B39109C|nr:OadG family transporter subunit [Petrimonas sp.]MEA4979701.1 OadG family transporter subunit [Petrimonas sp.]MEA5046847.1 OadG family transporter subunit [Petrimonas sp.]MEA5063480.1 OadG family transporter subunit [Petrimonas sp.]